MDAVVKWYERMGWDLRTRQSGGPIPDTSPFLLHQGEFVLPVDAVRRLGGTRGVMEMMKAIGVNIPGGSQGGGFQQGGLVPAITGGMSGGMTLQVNINGVNVLDMLSPEARSEMQNVAMQVVKRQAPRSILTPESERLADRALQKGYSSAL